MKRDNSVKELRGKLGLGHGREEEKELAKPITPNYFPKTSPSQFSYAEMIPGSPQHQLSPTSSNSLFLYLSSFALSFIYVFLLHIGSCIEKLFNQVVAM